MADDFIITRPSTPSPRNPQLSTHFNNADIIDRGLLKYGHRIWGFVIYRCTYDSDEDWAECMRRIRHQLTDALEFYGGLDLIEANPLTVFDDHSLFENASTSIVRQHFKQWTAAAPPREQGQGAGPGLYGGSPRYRLCVRVDAEALHSIVHEEPPPSGLSNGFVSLILGSWKPQSQEDLELAARELDLDEDEMSSLQLEAVESCTQEDVGWMKVKHRSLLGFYCRFQNPNAWKREYRRPPQVASS